MAGRQPARRKSYEIKLERWAGLDPKREASERSVNITLGTLGSSSRLLNREAV